MFLVDGPTEIKAINEKFAKEYGRTPALRRVGCNGKDVKPEGYVNAAFGTLIIAMSSVVTKIVCIIDREGRREEAVRFGGKVREIAIQRIADSSHISKKELDNKISVCVPDRMFENWIVADINGINTHKDLIKYGMMQKNYEGMCGVNVLKAIMKVPYKKTLHGPKLFKSVDFRRAKKNSASFKCFAETIGI